ncbi:mycofactocin system transcriptional regulator [Leucobacter sp. W1153]|uniref:mycofactocin system transcriptional regulator n=1 Tax=unclassified Leucobacter TaxID=2621730 RepID=UPI003F2E3068
MAQESGESPRLGRTPATSHREISRTAITLFLERGFDETFVDDIARAAGISRRTLFRYFPSKNDLPWGEFDELIDALRRRLAAVDQEISIENALRQVIIEVNDYPEDERAYHRHRMGLLLTVPSLAAHSTLRYAAWRQVVAEFVADRRGENVDALAPQAIAWACLGLCISAYERWLADDASDLAVLLNSAFAAAGSTFGVVGARAALAQ